jgi:hypothetical protein
MTEHKQPIASVISAWWSKHKEIRLENPMPLDVEAEGKSADSCSVAQRGAWHVLNYVGLFGSDEPLANGSD